MQLGHVILAESHLGRAQQECRLVVRQRQVPQTDLEDPAFRAQSGELYRRLVTPGEYQPGTVWHMIG